MLPDIDNDIMAQVIPAHVVVARAHSEARVISSSSSSVDIRQGHALASLPAVLSASSREETPISPTGSMQWKRRASALASPDSGGVAVFAEHFPPPPSSLSIDELRKRSKAPPNPDHFFAPHMNPYKPLTLQDALQESPKPSLQSTSAAAMAVGALGQKARYFPAHYKPSQGDLVPRPLGAERWFASVNLQRCWRGYAARSRLWVYHRSPRPDDGYELVYSGSGADLMALRIQRLRRGIAGRMGAADALEQQETRAANRLIALYLGFKGRQRARFARVLEANTAASRLQNIYRGRLGMRMYKAFRHRVRMHKANEIQRCYRGLRGRRLAGIERAERARQEARLRDAAARHKRGELLPPLYLRFGQLQDEIEKLAMRETAADQKRIEQRKKMRRASAIQWGVTSPRSPSLILREGLNGGEILQPSSVSRLAMKRGFFSEMEDFDEHGNDDDFSDSDESDEEEEMGMPLSPAIFSVPTTPCMRDEKANLGRKVRQLIDEINSVALCLLLVVHDHDSAVALYSIALLLNPTEPRLLYGRAVALQLYWSNWGSLGVRYPRFLDEALEHLRVAWSLDPDRTAYKIQERTHRAVLRLNPRCPRAMCGAAVMLQSVYGTFRDYRDDHALEVLKRCRGLYRRAAELDPECFHRHIMINAEAFESLFSSKREIICERVRRLRSGRADLTSWLMVDLRVYGCGGKIVISGNHKEGRHSVVAEGEQVAGTGAPHARFPGMSDGMLQRFTDHKLNNITYRDIVVHEDEVSLLHWEAKEFAVNDGRPQAVVDAEPALKVVAAYLMSNLVLVSTHNPRKTDPSRQRCRHLAIPRLVRVRDEDVQMAIQESAASRLQRLYRGFQGRALWRRLLHRARTKNEQEQRLAARRAHEQAVREYRFRQCAIIQARIKGILWRKNYAAMSSAARVVQRVFRAYRQRGKAAEEARRRLEGPMVYEMFKRGIVVSNVPLLLTVRRCGMSYKFIAHDGERCEVYVGYVYEKQLLEILEATQPADRDLYCLEGVAALTGGGAGAAGSSNGGAGGSSSNHNASVSSGPVLESGSSSASATDDNDTISATGSSAASSPAPGNRPMKLPVRNLNAKAQAMAKYNWSEEHQKRLASSVLSKPVKPWQHERVVNLLVSMLALVEPVTALSSELLKLDQGRTLVIDLQQGPNANGPGILRTKGLRRVLLDRAKSLKRYDTTMKKLRDKEEAMGKTFDEDQHYKSRKTKMHLVAARRHGMKGLGDLIADQGIAQGTGEFEYSSAAF